jgi:hypothetical protein
VKPSIVNPNASESVTKLIAAEVRPAASHSVELTLLTAPLGVAHIETRAEAAIGAYVTLDLLAEHHQGHDATVIAAFSDPGLAVAREIMPIPVVDRTEEALNIAAMMCGHFRSSRYRARFERGIKKPQTFNAWMVVWSASMVSTRRLPTSRAFSPIRANSCWRYANKQHKKMARMC